MRALLCLVAAAGLFYYGALSARDPEGRGTFVGGLCVLASLFLAGGSSLYLIVQGIVWIFT